MSYRLLPLLIVDFKTAVLCDFILSGVSQFKTSVNSGLIDNVYIDADKYIHVSYQEDNVLTIQWSRVDECYDDLIAMLIDKNKKAKRKFMTDDVYLAGAEIEGETE